MNDKYEFTDETKEFCGVTLRRIRAKAAFGIVAKGEIGGWVEKENNLQVSGDAWVYGDARVSGDAWVYGDARVSGDAWVSGNARVYGNARVSGNALVSGNAAINILAALGYYLTIHADAKIKMRFNVGCFSGTRKEFIAKAKEYKISPKAVKAALALADATIRTKP